jgi:hypothetical protein
VSGSRRVKGLNRFNQLNSPFHFALDFADGLAHDATVHNLWLILLVCLIAGCSTQSAGNLAKKAVTKTGSLATKATVATVKTTGKVAYAAGKTVVTTTGDVATAVIKAGIVTFKDTAVGISKEIPWTEGLKLYAASKTAEVDAGIRALQVLRGAKLFQQDWAAVKSGRGDIALQPGDVVTVVRK